MSGARKLMGTLLDLSPLPLLLLLLPFLLGQAQLSFASPPQSSIRQSPTILTQAAVNQVRIEATSFRGFYLHVHTNGKVFMDANYDFQGTKFDVIPSSLDAKYVHIRNASGALLLNVNDQVRCEHNVLKLNSFKVAASFVPVASRKLPFSFTFLSVKDIRTAMVYDEGTHQLVFSKVHSAPAHTASWFVSLS